MWLIAMLNDDVSVISTVISRDSCHCVEIHLKDIIIPLMTIHLQDTQVRDKACLVINSMHITLIIMSSLWRPQMHLYFTFIPPLFLCNWLDDQETVNCVIIGLLPGNDHHLPIFTINRRHQSLFYMSFMYGFYLPSPR